MKANELADQIENVINSLRSRIMGIGAEQYDDGDVQKIELKDPSSIIKETIEEIDDSIVYLSHLRARISKVQSTIDDSLASAVGLIRTIHRPISGPADDITCAVCAVDEINYPKWPCDAVKALEPSDEESFNCRRHGGSANIINCYECYAEYRDDEKETEDTDDPDE